MGKKFFAYGSCTNVDSFRATMKRADCEDKFSICGVGILNGYRLAFTRRSKKWHGGVLDIKESPEDYVLGVVYDVPERAVSAIDKREGAPDYYRRIENIKVELGHDLIEVFTYTVVDKQINEIKPTEEYFKTVYDGMKNRFPFEYINKYLINHCYNQFGMKNENYHQDHIYHDFDNPGTEFIKDNPEFYELLKQMTLFFGAENERVETVQPTPEMFRLLAKCAEIAARGELDFGHRIPRGIYNRLASEFQRISGLRIKRLPD